MNEWRNKSLSLSLYDRPYRDRLNVNGGSETAVTARVSSDGLRNVRTVRSHRPPSKRIIALTVKKNFM